MSSIPVRNPQAIQLLGTGISHSRCRWPSREGSTSHLLARHSWVQQILLKRDNGNQSGQVSCRNSSPWFYVLTCWWPDKDEKSGCLCRLLQSCVLQFWMTNNLASQSTLMTAVTNSTWSLLVSAQMHTALGGMSIFSIDAHGLLSAQSAHSLLMFGKWLPHCIDLGFLGLFHLNFLCFKISLCL